MADGDSSNIVKCLWVNTLNYFVGVTAYDGSKRLPSVRESLLQNLWADIIDGLQKNVRSKNKLTYHHSGSTASRVVRQLAYILTVYKGQCFISIVMKCLKTKEIMQVCYINIYKMQ